MSVSLIRALIIEDNAMAAEALKEMLTTDQDQGFAVECTGSLKAGLERLSKASFDLVLLDLDLPDARGSITCEKVRTAAPSLPIVIVSGSSEEQSVAADCLQRGAQDYLMKGRFDQQLLLHSVRYASQRKKIETEYQMSQRALTDANQALVDKVNELDQLNSLMMGREERILELKEEIKGLKARISDGSDENS